VPYRKFYRSARKNGKYLIKTATIVHLFNPFSELSARTAEANAEHENIKMRKQHHALSRRLEKFEATGNHDKTSGFVAA